MAANENTKFQVNFKTGDGSLINLYATDIKDLETGLTDLSMVASLIKSTSAELGSVPAAPARAAADIQAQFNAPAPAADPAMNFNPGQPGAKVCKHGPMAFKSGTSAKGPWQGYMCNSPKGSPDKCETIWVR
jgi:hypothetical protein